MKPSTNTREPGLMQTLRSLQFGIVVLITITVVAVIGTLLPQDQPPDFYHEHYGPVVNALVTLFRFDMTYRSPLFIGLLTLFALNIVLCSLVTFPALVRRTFAPDTAPAPDVLAALPVLVRVKGATVEDIGGRFASAGFPLQVVGPGRLFGQKGRLGNLGAFTVHISILLMLAGGLTSLLTGFRGHITLLEGESTDQVITAREGEVPLGFTLRLDRFAVEFYPDHPGRPKSYTSSVTVTRADGRTQVRDIRVNSPLMLNDFTVYQSSYGSSDEIEPVSAANDTAVVAVRLKGSPETMPPLAAFALPLGGEWTVPGFGDSITVVVGEMYRDFRRGGVPGDGANPAARLDVKVHGAVRWSVYTFMNFPGLNMPAFDDIPFAFMFDDLVMEEGEAGTAEPVMYSVFGVVRDRGIPLMWAGAVFMMLGLFFSFYIRSKRVWVCADDGGMVVAGTVKGDTDDFRRFLEKTARGN